MKLFDFIFKRSTEENEKNRGQRFEIIGDAERRFIPIGTGAAYSPETNPIYRGAADIVGRHISNFKPDLSQMKAKPKLKTRLQYRPNIFQSWRQFLYLCSVFTDITGTCYILPLYSETGEQIGIFPVMASDRVELVLYNETLYIRAYHGDGTRLAAPLENVGLITNKQFWHIWKGTDPAELVNTLLNYAKAEDTAAIENLAAGAGVRFVASAQAPLINSDIQKEADRSTLQALTDGKPLTLYSQAYGNLTQIAPHPYDAKEAFSKAKRADILTAAGVPESVYSGTATPDELALFYRQTLEPKAGQIEDAINAAIFTELESSYGNRIDIRANRLFYISEREITAIDAAKTAGLLTIDEMREILDFAPLPDDQGKTRYIRGEYYQEEQQAGQDPE